MIRQAVKYLFTLIGLDVRKGESSAYNKLAVFGIPISEWRYREKKYFLKILDVLVGEESPLLLGYPMAKEICLQGGGVFFYDEDKALRLTIKETDFYINYTDELFVIKEVFIDGEYDFKTADEVLVIDIGLNIGATSLYLSKKPQVKKIYAFELFEPTFREAKRNLSLNTDEKIECINVGLGKENRQLQLPYSISSKARMGFNGLPLNEQFPDVELVTVNVVDAAEEFMRIHQLDPTLNMVCKMDCEGAEVEILERLFETNVISLIDLYLIELHDNNTQEIEQQFLKSGFNVIRSFESSSMTGLIYAFKKNFNK